MVGIPNTIYDTENDSLVFRINDSVIVESRFPQDKPTSQLMYGTQGSKLDSEKSLQELMYGTESSRLYISSKSEKDVK